MWWIRWQRWIEEQVLMDMRLTIPIRHTDPDGMFGEDFDGNEEEGGPGPRSISLSRATQSTDQEQVTYSKIL